MREYPAPMTFNVRKGSVGFDALPPMVTRLAIDVARLAVWGLGGGEIRRRDGREENEWLRLVDDFDPSDGLPVISIFIG